MQPIYIDYQPGELIKGFCSTPFSLDLQTTIRDRMGVGAGEQQIHDKLRLKNILQSIRKEAHIKSFLTGKNIFIWTGAVLGAIGLTTVIFAPVSIAASVAMFVSGFVLFGVGGALVAFGVIKDCFKTNFLKKYSEAYATYAEQADTLLKNLNTLNNDEREVILRG